MKYNEIKTTLKIKSKHLIFIFVLRFATRTMGHHVAHCFHNKYKVENKTILKS